MGTHADTGSASPDNDSGVGDEGCACAGIGMEYGLEEGLADAAKIASTDTDTDTSKSISMPMPTPVVGWVGVGVSQATNREVGAAGSVLIFQGAGPYAGSGFDSALL